MLQSVKMITENPGSPGEFASGALTLQRKIISPDNSVDSG